jgi:hypothetical protein
MNRIARFEALAERLVEGTFARLFAGRLSPLAVLARLARAMEDHQAVSADGTPLAPTRYWVYLHPHDYEALAVEQQALEAELARDVAELAAHAGLALVIPPVVHVLADKDTAVHEVRVEARLMSQATDVEDVKEGTCEMPIGEHEAEAGEMIAPPGRPFLIVEGQRHVDLLQPVVSVGRALDNDIILEDPRVSRHHAQLRRRYGRYVLYDMGSSSGTQINEYPVEECVLHSGDVVSFAGVQVIYGEDPPTPIPLPGVGDTPAFSQNVESD